MHPGELELAKEALKNAFETVKELLEPFLGPPIKEVGEILGDQARLFRFQNQIKILKRARSSLEAAGLNPQRVPLKILVPILQDGSLEEDESMTERWAALLANAASPGESPETLPSFPQMLKELAPREALLIDTIFDWMTSSSIIREHWHRHGVKSSKLSEHLHLSDSEFKIAIENLFRLRLCSPPSTELSGIIMFNEFPNRRFQLQMTEIVCLTELGHAFVRACRSPDAFEANSGTGLKDNAAQADIDAGENLAISDPALRLASGMVIEGPSPLSFRVSNGLVTVEIAPFTASFRERKQTRHYNSGSIAALEMGVNYYVYFQDDGLLGGAVAYQASTVLHQALLPGRIYVGHITVPQSPGS